MGAMDQVVEKKRVVEKRQVFDCANAQKSTITNGGTVKHTTFHVGVLKHHKVHVAVGKNVVTQFHVRQLNMMEPCTVPHGMGETAVGQTSVRHTHLGKRGRLTLTPLDRKQRQSAFCKVGA